MMIQIKNNLTVTNRTAKANRDIKYIVVHYTGNNGDTAHANTNYFKSVNRNSSAHYFVDENSIWQCVADNDIAWHCGTSGAYYHSECRNANSIGIEMCNSVSRNAVVEQNTVELIRYLMNKYSIDTAHILRHYDVTHKLCPAPLIDSGEWEDFKNKIGGNDEMTDAEKQKMQELETRLANIESNAGIKYGYIDANMPDWARPTVQKLVGNGILTGDATGNLKLSHDIIRVLVMLDRKGIFG